MTAFDENFIAWARYLFWAEINKNKLEELFDSTDDSEKIPTSDFFAYSSLWYGSLFVVIEGWETLKLKDDTINALLVEHDDLKSLLRRYRNGVCHFQPKLLDNRFVAFGSTKHNSYLWAKLLHQEFVRYFSDWLAALPGDQEQKSEIKESIKRIIGWVPENTFNDQIRSLSHLIQESEAMIKDHEETQAGNELKDIIEKTKKLLQESRTNYDKFLAESRKSIKS
jgi:hypothetical protein